MKEASSNQRHNEREFADRFQSSIEAWDVRAVPGMDAERKDRDKNPVYKL